MTTEELAVATQIDPDVILRMLDMGLLRAVVRLVRGRPVFDTDAVAVIDRAAELADRAAAGEITTVDAWMQIRAPKSRRSTQ
jgi:hypothetical protein